MLKRLSTDTLNWIIIIGVILFVIEIAFFHGGMIGTAIFTGFLVFIGWKNYTALWGKVFFWIGLIGLIFSVVNMIAVRFLIIAFIVLFLIDYTKNRNNVHIQPTIYLDKAEDQKEEPLISISPLFRNLFFGDQQTEDTAYHWQDINIHGGIGNRVIDLSNTVLPEDTSVISIRHLVGNIIIYVPYEVEVMIHHSAVFGRVYIFNEQHYQLMDHTISYKTKNYDTT